MQPSETRYDVASALSQGRRDYQEDAVVTDFPIGADQGVIVLSDGMGGHAAGDIASKIVMTEVFCELKFQAADSASFQQNVREILLGAAQGANECLGAHVAEHPEAAGMGATLVAAAIVDRSLHWVSVGDSPLYLFRGGALGQVNEDHSMAPQIDQMVAAGVLDEEAARNHPDRNALTSVLSGEEVDRVDCPEEPIALQNGDIILVASDGVQFLENDILSRTIGGLRTKSSSDIARAILNKLHALADPEQDNISLAVIKVEFAEVDDDMTAALRTAFRTFEAIESDDEVAAHSADAQNDHADARVSDATVREPAE